MPKFDLGFSGSEWRRYYFTVDGNYAIDDIEMAIKAGNTVSRGTVKGPSATCNTLTPSPTPTPTNTATNVPDSAATPTDTPTNTLLPTATSTNTLTNTPIPTETPTSTPTETPLPTAMLTETPTITSIPTATLAAMPTARLIPTAMPTEAPTDTRLPTATSTDRPANIPVRASIGDKVWHDVNANGIQDDGELGLAEVTVILYDRNNQVVATTTTDDAGMYSFNGLAPGIYSVGVSIPGESYYISHPDISDNDANDSDADPQSGRTPPIELPAGKNDLTWDVGITTPPILSIQKHADMETVQPGSAVNYTLNYSNIGLGDATGVVVREVVPNNTTFVPENSTVGWACEGGLVVAGTICTYTVGNLPAGAEGDVLLTFFVVSDAILPNNVTTIENQVMIQDDGTHGKPPTALNTALVTLSAMRPTASDTTVEPGTEQETIYLPLVTRRKFRNLLLEDGVPTLDQTVLAWWCSFFPGSGELPSAEESPSISWLSNVCRQ